MELEKHRRVWLLFGISAVLLLVYVSSSSYNNDRSYSIWQRHAIDRDLVVADYASKWTARFGEKLKKWDTQRKRKLLAMNAFASIKHPDDPAKLIWKEPSDGQKLAIAIVEPRNHSCLPAVLYNFAHGKKKIIVLCVCFIIYCTCSIWRSRCFFVHFSWRRN
jgi:hypothetical protein